MTSEPFADLAQIIGCLIQAHLECFLIEPLRYLPAWLNWDCTEKLEPRNITDRLWLKPIWYKHTMPNSARVNKSDWLMGVSSSNTVAIKDSNSGTIPKVQPVLLKKTEKQICGTMTTTMKKNNSPDLSGQTSLCILGISTQNIQDS